MILIMYRHCISSQLTFNKDAKLFNLTKKMNLI